jgi:hypothetical protein
METETLDLFQIIDASNREVRRVHVLGEVTQREKRHTEPAKTLPTVTPDRFGFKQSRL